MDQARLEGIALYPNPANSKIYVESPVNIIQIEICDLRAAVLSDLNAKDHKVELDVSLYPQGIYIAKIYREGLRAVSVKLVITE